MYITCKRQRRKLIFGLSIFAHFYGHSVYNVHSLNSFYKQTFNPNSLLSVDFHYIVVTALLLME